MTTYYADSSALFLQETSLSHDLSAPIMLSADRELLGAAQAEGLMTDDPNTHP